MYESFIESLKESLNSINFENVKEFLVEFGNKLRSSNNLACMITLICMDVLLIILLSKMRKESKSISTIKSKIVPPYGLAIEGKYFPFRSEEVLIGRHPSCDIRCLNLTVSRYHAIVSFKGGKWYIEDIDSTYGTFINGRFVDEVTSINVGDDIQLGEQHFTVESTIGSSNALQEGE